MTRFCYILIQIFIIQSLYAGQTDRCALLMTAEPFGFGPAAAAAQLANNLRPSIDLLGYVGEGHTLDLQKEVGYDEIFALNRNPSDEEIRAFLRAQSAKYSHFFSALDFRYARLAHEEGFRVGVYDPLTWYWKTIPRGVRDFDLYIAQDFIDVNERIARDRLSFPQNLSVVPPVVPDLRSGYLLPIDRSALVNFGGLSNPYMSDETLFRFSMLVLDAVQAALSEIGFKADVVANPKLGVELTKSEHKLGAISSKSKINVQTLSPAQIQSKLTTTTLALMTSGLGNIYEASSAHALVVWLPPVNDSQGQQIELLRQNDMADAWIDWSDFTDEGKIDYFADQQEVLGHINSRMQRTLANPAYQIQLRRVVRERILSVFNQTERKIGKLTEKYGTGGDAVLAHEVLNWAKPVFETMLGAGGEVALDIKTHYQITPTEGTLLNAHIPGLGPCSDATCPTSIKVESFARDGFLEMVHEAYGLARREWIKRDIFPVHAACVGNERDGYSLLIGPSGSGKTSVALHLLEQNENMIFSGDKTLVRFNEEGEMHAISGTRALTYRTADKHRWPNLDPAKSFVFGDRTLIELPSSKYVNESMVKISRVFILDENEGVELALPVSKESALHKLYPYFLDRQREDVILGFGKAMVDGSTPLANREKLASSLRRSFETLPVTSLSSSTRKMAEMVNDTLAKANSQGKAPISIPANSPPKKIVMGICGIGNGHMNRQIPVLKHLLDVGHEVIVLVSEGRSHEILDRFSGYPNLKVMDTANPYFVGGEAGLDFLATAEAQKNSVQFLQVNARVLHEITSFFGRADLVISDYELVSAQYAYAKGASLVTLDQQSKYLRGSFPPNLNGSTYQDEVERLRMFFPLATKRFALSFFNVDQADAKVIDGEVSLHAPIIRTALIERINQEKSSKPSLVVYMSDQHAADSGLESWSTVLSTQPEIDVHVFLPRRLRKPENYANLHFYFHGDQSFDDLLAAAHGVVATAGHSLLSEAMFLEIPVLALPLPLYEQQMNAHIIDAHGFGLSSDKLTSTSLDEFVRHLDMYTNNIRRDQRVLLRPNAEPSLFGEIDNLLK